MLESIRPPWEGLSGKSLWKGLFQKTYLGDRPNFEKARLGMPTGEVLLGKAYLGQPIGDSLFVKAYLGRPFEDSLFGTAYLGQPIWNSLFGKACWARHTCWSLSKRD